MAEASRKKRRIDFEEIAMFTALGLMALVAMLAVWTMFAGAREFEKARLADLDAVRIAGEVSNHVNVVPLSSPEGTRIAWGTGGDFGLTIERISR